jgi:class 3 adenylate cyclase
VSFLEVVRGARAHLQEQGRVSLRALRREFELDDDALEELVEELVDVQEVASRQKNILVWAGDSAPSPAPLPSATAEEPAPAERSPRDYTPHHLADKILQSKSALEGERKQVTVLFADVKGSMELAEQVDPEVWHGVLDRFFQILSEGIHRFEGTVNQYTGDGIMALFGAPISHEDHAQRACFAALHLKGALRDYADELRRTRGLSFSTRIGINSGTVVVGKIGDDLRMDYTAQGQTVGLAQRMEALAEPGCTYLADGTRRLVEGYFALRSLGDFAVKGVSDSVPVYELEGLGAQRTRLDRSRAPSTLSSSRWPGTAASSVWWRMRARARAACATSSSSAAARATCASSRATARRTESRWPSCPSSSCCAPSSASTSGTTTRMRAARWQAS